MASTAVAMSGGGHRACAFALGVALYLADANRTGDIVSVASVSGGSLANGALAQDLDLRTASASDVQAAVARTARKVTGLGTLFGAKITIAYLAGLFALALVVAIGPWLLPIAMWLKLLVFLGGALILAWAANLRGRVCARGYGKTLFSPVKKPTRLAAINASVDHVICATDLHAGENVYFSARFICSYRFGLGTPGNLPLHTAVQASAAFPGAFPLRGFAAPALASTAAGRRPPALARWLSWTVASTTTWPTSGPTGSPAVRSAGAPSSRMRRS